MRSLLLPPLLLSAIGPALPGQSPAAEWQWSVEMKRREPAPPGANPRAFLWIPPSRATLQGAVVAQQSFAEATLLDHPAFRATLADLGFAAIWIAPAFDLEFAFETGAGAEFDALLTRLAAESGYTELAHVPIVPLGHSAAASFPWNFARWAPERTLALISLSGQWPYGAETPDPVIPDRALDGVPALVVIGEYEWAVERTAAGLEQRAAHATLPLTMLAEAGGGHFDVSEDKVRYLGLYLRKAVQHRIETPPTRQRAAKLRFIDPTVTGWLADRWRFNEFPRVPAAPVDEYAEPEEAFWCFDEEHAVATETYRADQRGKRAALLAFRQDGAVVPQTPGSHAQVMLAFRPLADGLTFQLDATFLTEVPAGRPERWTGRKAGTPLAAPSNPQLIEIAPVNGPVLKRDRGTFALRFGRLGLPPPGRTTEVWFTATHPGDARFRRSVQQAVLSIPARNEVGAAQTIRFASIPDQPAAGIAGRTLPLTAESSAGPEARVHFYVREGPAVVEGDTLRFTSVPARATLPMRVTVVAWQWGRSLPPLLRTAEPVTHTFMITP